jgi:hypothetical protein
MISPVSSTDRRRLRDVGQLRVGCEVERFRLLDGLDEDGRLGSLAHGADDLLVALVADEDDRVALVGVASCLHVHLRDERAHGVDHVVAQLLRVRENRRRDAVGGVDDRRSARHLCLFLDEDRSARLEIANDMDVAGTICLRT